MSILPFRLKHSTACTRSYSCRNWLPQVRTCCSCLRLAVDTLRRWSKWSEAAELFGGQMAITREDSCRLVQFQATIRATVDRVSSRVPRRSGGSPNLVRSVLDLVWGKGFRGKRKKEERERERKIVSHFLGFRNLNLFFFRFFETKSYFCVFKIVFSIFNKYDTKMDFQVNILN